MKVYIVGIGVSGGEMLTREAENALAEAELLIGAKRMLEDYTSTDKELFCSYKPDEIASCIKKSDKSVAAVLMSGDCGFFSGAKKLLPLLDGADVRIVSGISSAVYFCSRLGISYEDMKYVSLHGRNDNIAINVKTNEKCFFLLGGEQTASDVCRQLCKFNLGRVRVYIGENLGYKNERIISGYAEELSNGAEEYTEKLAVLVTVNPDHLRFIPSAIDDEKFIRDNTPMTKAEVRSIAVSALEICKDSVCWDIGCGSGSVSMEMAYRCPEGMVLAFDKKNVGVENTLANAARFGCDNVHAFLCEFPNMGSESEPILDRMGTPDKVFIGGTSGKLEDVLGYINGLNPDADIVLTAVSLETLAEATRCFERFGGKCSVSQIAVTRTKKVGSHTMLDALNPIFIIKGRLK